MYLGYSCARPKLATTETGKYNLKAWYRDENDERIPSGPERLTRGAGWSVFKATISALIRR